MIDFGPGVLLPGAPGGVAGIGNGAPGPATVVARVLVVSARGSTYTPLTDSTAVTGARLAASTIGQSPGQNAFAFAIVLSRRRSAPLYNV